ncbi:MAG: PIN domain-containing protein [Proteobacteria bacterium]|nr:PIN domain-containing protein [Pseudomonadota bacterium]
MRALLDVNVLIALLDGSHMHHGQAHAWLDGNIRQGWASCPITQNGCVRILSQNGYPDRKPIAEVALRLREATLGSDHEFWPDDVSALSDDVLDWRHLLGARQITDAYLLALAVKHNGRLVTFDPNIPVTAIRGAAARHLAVI